MPGPHCPSQGTGCPSVWKTAERELVGGVASAVMRDSQEEAGMRRRKPVGVTLGHPLPDRVRHPQVPFCHEARSTPSLHTMEPASQWSPSTQTSIASCNLHLTSCITQ